MNALPDIVLELKLRDGTLLRVKREDWAAFSNGEVQVKDRVYKPHEWLEVRAKEVGEES